jgi:DnaJ-class molecular chaperone
MVASTSSSSSYYNNNNNNRSKSKYDEEHFLLKKFVTSSGEVINPYNVLNVPRDANRADIKGNYKQLAKKYHPDTRNKKILPGKW